VERRSGLIQGLSSIAALIAAMALVLALAAPAMANDGQQTNVAWNDVNFQGDEGECADADLDPGQVLWHFVQTGVSTDSGNLTAVFASGAVGPVANYASPGSTLHWNIITGETTLISFSSDVVSDGNLVLSHICNGGPPPEIPEAPIALMLPVIAVLAFGSYLVINRRRVTSVA
jgi:hypothetical protein